jgi:hypothetical protein
MILSTVAAKVIVGKTRRHPETKIDKYFFIFIES